jgi:NitT/TauT family transport system substrate-binding protein
MQSAKRNGIGRRTLLLAGAATAGAGLLSVGPARSAEKFKILHTTSPPDPAFHYYYYALENGFYRKHGLDVEIKALQAESTNMRALLAGEGDIGAALGAPPPLRAADAGAQLKCIASYTLKLDYLIIGDKGIPDLKALEGRSFAIAQVNTLSQLVPSLMIKRAGGDPSKVKWVSVGNSAARLQAAIANRVDAAIVNAALTTKAAAYQRLYTLGSAADSLPDFLYTWDVTTAELYRKKPAAFAAYAAATSEGIRWAMANRDKALAISKRVLPDVPEPEVEAAINEFMVKNFWSASGIVPKQVWEYTTKTLLDAGQINAIPNVDEFLVGRAS